MSASQSRLRLYNGLGGYVELAAPPSGDGGSTATLPPVEGTVVVVSDVPLDGQTLVYDATSGVWRPAAGQSGGSDIGAQVALSFILGG